jgi:hypothetical protein
VWVVTAGTRQRTHCVKSTAKNLARNRGPRRPPPRDRPRALPHGVLFMMRGFTSVVLFSVWELTLAGDGGPGYYDDYVYSYTQQPTTPSPMGSGVTFAPTTGIGSPTSSPPTAGCIGPCVSTDVWDSGFGGCTTYAVGGPNHAYCANDADWTTMVTAYEACPGCGRCDCTSASPTSGQMGQPTSSQGPTTQTPTQGPPTTHAPTVAPTTPAPTTRSPTPFGYTYNPTAAPTTLAPTLAPPEPFFVVVESQPAGACFVTDSGSCVTNGNGVVAAYGVQSCNVAVLRQGVLSAPVGFNIDAMASLNVRGYVAGDGYTLLGGTVFSSQQSPANQRVEAGDALFWRYGWDATNVSVFRVCASRFVAA